MCYGLRVNPVRLFLLASVCLLAIPHAGAQAPTGNAYDPERPALVAFAFDGFKSGVDERRARGDAEEKLLERFGKPARTESTTQGEHYGPVRTKYWYYDGLEIVSAQPVGASDTWLRKIILTSPDRKLKFDLSIGTKRSQFLATLGPPYDPSGAKFGSFVYYADDYWSKGGVAYASHAGVEISFDQHDRAEKIVWDYYAD
jgi:hypothetical protein